MSRPPLRQPNVMHFGEQGSGYDLPDRLCDGRTRLTENPQVAEAIVCACCQSPSVQLTAQSVCSLAYLHSRTQAVIN